MPSARGSLVLSLAILGSCDGTPPAPEFGPAAVESVLVPLVPVPQGQPRLEVLAAPGAGTCAPLRVRWSPLAHELLAAEFASLASAPADERVDLAVEPDRSAMDRVARGDAALAVVATELTPWDRQRGLAGQPCGRFVPVLVVNETNPVRSVTSRAMREAATGQTRHWRPLGGRADADIELAVPEAKALRQRSAALLIAGDRFANDAVKLPDEAAVLAFVRSRPNALGVVGAASLAGTGAAGVRALSIDGATPDSADYRWQTPLTLVTRVDRDARTERLLARLRKPPM